MNDYTLALLALLAALISLGMAAAIAIKHFLRKNQASARQRTWLALAIATLLLALQQAYALELALKTGLYDLPQSLLAGFSGLCLAIVCASLRQPTD